MVFISSILILIFASFCIYAFYSLSVELLKSVGKTSDSFFPEIEKAISQVNPTNFNSFDRKKKVLVIIEFVIKFFLLSFAIYQIYRIF